MMTDSVSASIRKVKTKAIVQKIFGWAIAIFCGLITFVGMVQIREVLDVVMVTFFAGITALGVLLIVKGNKKTRLIKAFYDYSARFEKDPEKSIDLLATSIGVTATKVAKNVEDMLGFGFFPNCYLDKQYNKLVVPSISTPQTPAVSATASDSSTQSVKFVAVQCKNCGATNKIVMGTVGECEFCGTQISE